MKFSVECEMGERWMMPFLAMLEEMEYQGNIGHSGLVSIFADGDGDFHPHFMVRTLKVKPIKKTSSEVVFDRYPEEKS